MLASDVQVDGPETGEELVGETDEVRFALTSEAGLNDGLAFPFVYLGVLLAAGGSGLGLAAEWVAWYVVVKILVGLLLGVLVGTALARVAFRSRLESLRIAERGEPLLALAALLGAYGVAELAQGYGFLAVFACAMALRAAERGHRYHRAMHDVMERLERLLTLFLLLAMGIALTRGLLDALTWAGVGVAVALVFVIRPATALLALSVRGRDPAEIGGLERRERLATAFLGIRGRGLVVLPGLRGQPGRRGRRGVVVVHGGLHHRALRGRARDGLHTRDALAGPARRRGRRRREVRSAPVPRAAQAAAGRRRTARAPTVPRRPGRRRRRCSASCRTTRRPARPEQHRPHGDLLCSSDRVRDDPS